MHIHCIFKQHQLQIIEVIKSFKGISKVTHDNTFDEAVYWSENLPDKPDLIICDEYAYGSQFDAKTGTLNKDKAILEALKKIRFNLPNTRIIILLHAHRKKDLVFLQYLISLAIYDFHFISQTFTQDNLLHFLTAEPRTLKDVSMYVTTTEIRPNSDFANLGFKLAYPEKEEEAKGLFSKFKKEAEKVAKKAKLSEKRETAHDIKGVFQKAVSGVSWYSLEPNSPPPTTTSIPASYIPSILEEESWTGTNTSSQITEKTTEITIYSTGLKEHYPFTTCGTFELLQEQLKEAKPDAIIFGVNTPNLFEHIKKLRRNKELLDVPIAVLGTEPTKELLTAGADECFLEWDQKACVCLEAKKERLSEMWAMANDEASRDQLTGVYNRKPLERFGREQLEKYNNSGIPFSLLICDLDFFKKVNDTYGHQVGDKVLKKFAGFLKENIREVDVIFRYGGEEFFVFFPNTRKQEAFEIANRLCRGWAAIKFYDSTFSGGLAEYSEEMESIETLIEIADKYLYEAKQAGRNQIRINPSPVKVKPAKPDCNDTFKTEHKQQISEEKPQVLQPTMPVRESPAGISRAKTVAITSLISGGGASNLSLSLIKHLIGQQSIAIIDGDLEQRKLGTMLGVSNELLANHSWDKEIAPVVSGKTKLYPLSKQFKTGPPQGTLKNLISLARQEADLVLIDCGSIKDTWYYRSILEEADIILWNYIDNSIPPDEARSKWTERLKILASLKARHREVIAFHGQVAIDLIEDVFHVSAVKMQSNDDPKSLNQLLEVIKKAPFQGNARILVSGYDKDFVPNKASVLYDVIFDPDEASEWVKNHHYDAAIVNPEIRGAALLEFDLKERGITVQK